MRLSPSSIRVAERRGGPEGTCCAKTARLPAGLEIRERARHRLFHGTANLMVGYRDALAVEVLAQLLEHAVAAGLVEVGRHDLHRIRFGGRTDEAELIGGPQADR